MYMYISIYKYKYRYIYVYVYMYEYIYAYIYTHTHTHGVNVMPTRAESDLSGLYLTELANCCASKLSHAQAKDRNQARGGHDIHLPGMHVQSASYMHTKRNLDRMQSRVHLRFGQNIPTSGVTTQRSGLCGNTTPERTTHV